MKRWKIYEHCGKFLWVSDNGDVLWWLNCKPLYQRLNGLSKHAYYTIRLQDNKKITTLRIHRMVATLFVDNTENKPYVNHIDGNKLNNHYNNLEWCTHQENMQHAHDTGLCLRKGQHNSRATLTESIVHEICQWFQDNPTLGAKAATEIFDVPFGILSKIRSGQTWQHVRGLYKILPLTGRAKFND